MAGHRKFVENRRCILARYIGVDVQNRVGQLFSSEFGTDHKRERAGIRLIQIIETADDVVVFIGIVAHLQVSMY